ncbi:reverse transcriptase domain-containing protein [Tanacetum coccineum]
MQAARDDKEFNADVAKADGVRSWRQSYAQGLTLERSRTVRLELPQELSRVHHTFHVSNLKKCYADEPLVMPLEGIHVDDKLQFVEEPVEIMEREIKRLKRSRIPLVKVRWNSRRGPEFTWEREDSFKQKYPQLFTNRASSSTTRFEGVTDWHQSQGYREPVTMSSATSDVTYTSVYTDSEPGREDPEGYEDDETEDGPVDYPMDGGDDGDDDDGDSSRDDARDEDEDEEDEEDEEEEEHLAPADSTTVIPADEPVFPPEGIELVIPPPSLTYYLGLGYRRPQTSISLPSEAEGVESTFMTLTTPSPSPPISLSPPSAGERLARCTAPPAHSPPLPPSSRCLTQNQTLRIASTQALIDAVTTALPPPPLPLLPPSLYISSPIDRRDDIPESEQPPCKRLYLSTIGSRYEIGESSTARPARGQGIDYGFVSTVDAEERQQGIRDVGYGIRDTWVDPAEAVPEIAPMTVGEVNTRVTELAELHERDTQDLYALLEDAQDSRSRISQRVDMDSQRVDLLMGDRMTLQETGEAWARSIGLSQATHQELQTHRDHVYAHETYLQAHQTQLQLQSTLIQTQHQVHETRFQMQHAELAALRETDRRRQDQMVETLRVIRDMRREMSDMQAELLALREQQRRARQPGPEARIPDHQEASGDADRAEGVVGLTRWIEKMESVFNISGCAVENQVKFATCTLLGAALTWWNGQIRTFVFRAYAMTWEVLKKKMTDKYCPQGEIKKLEIELWNLKVKGNDVPAYTERFQELTLICTKFVANETEKVGKYLVHWIETFMGTSSAKPKTLDETIEWPMTDGRKTPHLRGKAI